LYESKKQLAVYVVKVGLNSQFVYLDCLYKKQLAVHVLKVLCTTNKSISLLQFHSTLSYTFVLAPNCYTVPCLTFPHTSGSRRTLIGPHQYQNPFLLHSGEILIRVHPNLIKEEALRFSMQAGLYPYGLQLVWMTTTNFHLPYISSQFPWSLLRENSGGNPLL